MTSSPTKLRQHGVIIASLPAEYAVNYLNGNSGTARTRKTLNEAIELAEQMAQNAAAAAAAAQKATHRPKRRLSMRPKAIIKRRIKAHSRRLRAKAT